MDLPHSTPIDINTVKPKKTEFGNPVWTNDDIEVPEDRREGRREGFKDALRILEGPSILSNNTEFDTGVNCCLSLLRRRLAEL